MFLTPVAGWNGVDEVVSPHAAVHNLFDLGVTGQGGIQAEFQR